MPTQPDVAIFLAWEDAIHAPMSHLRISISQVYNIRNLLQSSVIQYKVYKIILHKCLIFQWFAAFPGAPHNPEVGGVLYGWGGLTLGPYCNIAAHTVFATIGHDVQIQPQPMALAPHKSGPIVLEEDIWVAANCTIAANTRIARGCVIGANSVVTKDTEPFGLYLGAPATRRRDRIIAQKAL